MTRKYDSERKSGLRVFCLFVWLCLAALICGGCGREEVTAYLADDTEITSVSLSEDVSVTTSSQSISTESDPAESDSEKLSVIQVYICGAVANPGVYKLHAGDRVVQVVEAAGGLLPDADDTAINQARILCDGEQITILTREETAAEKAAAETAETSAAGETSSGKVNLNQATKEQLMTLSGIGEKKAADIISYRETHGPFSDIEQIKEVSGIGDKLYEQISGMIEV